MDILSTQATSSATPAQTAISSDNTVLSSDFETFLQMLTAQAKYQDPLEPIDSTEYASQLAQFSSVEQQVKSNDLLASLVSQMGSSNMAQFAGWIGMDARSVAPAYFDGSPIEITPNPASVADEVDLVVLDQDGKEVQRQPISVSSEPVSWVGLKDNGQAFENGLYSFQIESRAEGKVVLSEPGEVYSRITEARSVGGETKLILEGGALVSTDSITALRAP